MKKKENEGVEAAQDVTIEDVKAIDCFKNLTDEQAEEVIEYVKVYCRLVHTAYKLQKLKQKNKVSNNNSEESANQKQAA
jgi:uncharacterized protein YgfB (UPF0149 family)